MGHAHPDSLLPDRQSRILCEGELHVLSQTITQSQGVAISPRPGKWAASGSGWGLGEREIEINVVAASVKQGPGDWREIYPSINCAPRQSYYPHSAHHRRATVVSLLASDLSSTAHGPNHGPLQLQ